MSLGCCVDLGSSLLPSKAERYKVSTKKVLKSVIVLTGLYFLCQILADITAVKIVSFAGLNFPGGTLIYAATFTIRDLIQKRFGKIVARQVIVAAGIFNLLMAAYFLLIQYMAPAFFWDAQPAFTQILGMVPRIVLASIIAEIVSELLDTEVYSGWMKLIGDRWQWTRVLVSNAISLPVDSIIFGFLAFYGMPHWPTAQIWHAIEGQIIIKAAITLLSLPAIYFVRARTSSSVLADS